MRSTKCVLCLLVCLGSSPTRALAQPAAAESGSRSDGVLLELLTTLFDRTASSEARRKALTSSALSDPRAKAPLIFLLADPDPLVRAGAATALGRFVSDPHVEQTLGDVATRTFEPPYVRIAALDSMLSGSDAIAGPLQRIYADEETDISVRTAAKKILAFRFPALLLAGAADEMVDRRGRLSLVVGSAALGSYGMAAIGGLGRNDAGVTIGAFGGALVGAGTAFLLTRSGEMSLTQAGWAFSGGAWGAGLGMLAAGTLDRDPSQRLVLALGLLGESAALAATAVTRKTMPFDGGDVLTINLGGLVAADLAIGALAFDEGSDRRKGRLVVLGAAAGGLMAGALGTRKLRFMGGDAAMTLEGAYEGAWAGGLSASAFGARSSRTSGAIALGAGLGFIGGAALAQVTDYQTRDAPFIFVLGTYGKVLGVSLPMLADGNDERLAAGALIGSVVSVAAAHLVAPRRNLGNSAPSFVAFGTALGLWHGIALGEASSRLTSRQRGGAALLGASAAGLGAMPLSTWLQPTTYDTAALAGGAFWGTWFSAWGRALAGGDHGNDMRLQLAAGDAGMAVSGLLISPVVAVDPRRMGVANLGGLAGAAIGSLAVALASKDRDAVITGNLAGSGAGLIFGSILAANLRFSPPRPETAARNDSSAWRRALARLPAPQLVPLVLPPQNSPDGRGATVFGMGLFFANGGAR